ncbi:UNVERIFIED_CONTAM: hypothetical protein H355_007473, partial [Colinus virginianus]
MSDGELLSSKFLEDTYPESKRVSISTQFEKLIDEVIRRKDFEMLEQYLEREDCENISYKCSKQFVNKLDKLLCQIVYDSRPEGKMEMLENFVLRICTIITDVRINIYVQQEVVRKLNLMLDSMPQDARKKIFSTKEMLLVMSDMSRRILDAGDYDLQVAITEALCRMIPEKQRREMACQWFSMEFVSSAFKGIKDSEFETDCRKFLNQVNGMLGEKRRVFTYPCLSAALDKYELQLPLDENLEEFWIDFNVGSRSVSFYVAADTADQQWETVIIPEEEVQLYNLEAEWMHTVIKCLQILLRSYLILMKKLLQFCFCPEKDSKKLLTIDLKSPMNVGNQEGEKFFLYFDSILEIEDVARKIFGIHKCKEFSKKQSMSVAKTTVHIVFDESGSQNGQRRTPDNQSCETAQNTRKPKVREQAELPEKGVCSEEVLHFLPEAENGAPEKQTSGKSFYKCDALDIVPDSQRAGRSNKPILPGPLESSSDKKRTWKKRPCSVPEENITTGDRQSLNLSSGQARHTDSILSERAMKHKAFSSIFGRASPDKQKDKRKQRNGIEITREENCKMQSGQSKCTDDLEQKQLNTGRKNASATTETFKACLSNEGPETSLHSDFRKYSTTKEEAAVLSRKETADHERSKMVRLSFLHFVNLDDVYNFDVSGFNEPTIKIGTRNNQNKKHLFSDTDTEYRGDDSKTDISWLQKSKAVSKPQIIDYSRNKNLGKSKRKCKNVLILPKLTECKKQSSVTDEMMEQTTRPKRPRRAVLPKNYKDPSSSESESEREYSAYTSKKEKSAVQLSNCCLGAERMSEGCVTQDRTSSEELSALQKSTPEEKETLNLQKGISPNNLCLQKKNTQSLYLNQSPEMNAKNLTFGNKSFSPVLNASYVLNLTSVNPYKKYCGKTTEGSASETCDANKHLTFGHGFSEKNSTEGKQRDHTKAVINKGESRSQKMEHFAKQSLRAANQHLTTMHQQLLECRIKQLDKFHFVILQEIENFEKDSQSLKNMEKELLSQEALLSKYSVLGIGLWEALQSVAQQRALCANTACA